jgi:acyl-CoA thioester hydrolase
VTGATASRPDTGPGQGLFSVRIDVRIYELDGQGHVNSAVYHQYAEHARWCFLAAAGIDHAVLLGSGVGPVFLESTIRFRRELGAGDRVDVTCELRDRGYGRTFVIPQRIQLADGTLAAELESVCGLLDLQQRKLVPDPLRRLADLATDPVGFLAAAVASGDRGAPG